MIRIEARKPAKLLLFISPGGKARETSALQHLWTTIADGFNLFVGIENRKRNSLMYSDAVSFLSRAAKWADACWTVFITRTIGISSSLRRTPHLTLLGNSCWEVLYLFHAFLVPNSLTIMPLLINIAHKDLSPIPSSPIFICIFCRMCTIQTTHIYLTTKKKSITYTYHK